MKPASHPPSHPHTEINVREDLIDTYELFAGIFKESGVLFSYIPKLDTTLPLIYGKRPLVQRLFSEFISACLYPLSSLVGSQSVQISHTKSRTHWIFTLQIHSSTVDILPVHSLSFHKGSVQSVFGNASNQSTYASNPSTHAAYLQLS